MIVLNGFEYGTQYETITQQSITVSIVLTDKHGTAGIDYLISNANEQIKNDELFVNGEPYKGYQKLENILIDPATMMIKLTFSQVYNDQEALAMLIGERISVSEASEKRAEIETLASFADDDTASKNAWAFPAWSGDSVVYEVGQRVQYAALLYKCIQAHTSQDDWTPDTAVSLWARTSDPAEEWPAWIQPLGSEDSYQSGDKVSHNSKHWVSTVNSNVWEPGVYGWEEQQ